MNNKKCIVCNHDLKLKFSLKYLVYQCPSCRLYSSDAIFDLSFRSSLEESNREVGLKKLRLDNFGKIVEFIKSKYYQNCDEIFGLEIGCGNGWWLDVCQQNAIKCIGIEPETTFRDYYDKNNLSVIEGFYPHPALKPEKGYDFIIFNDVFEHISDLDNLILNVKKDLKKDGLLIVNLPMSNGFFYRMAQYMYLLKVNSFLERLWQFNFHSPHINYFDSKNLASFLAKYGFQTNNDFRLETLDFSSIRQRILSDNSNGKIKAFVLSQLLFLMKPVIMRTNPDIKVFFFRQ